MAIDLARAEDEDAIRMVERRGQPAFALEELAFRRVRPSVKYLERHPPAALDLVRLVDNTHPTAPKQSDDPIVAKNRTCCEKGCVWDCGRRATMQASDGFVIGRVHVRSDSEARRVGEIIWRRAWLQARHGSLRSS
jgi:hypothetical protein